MSQHQPPEPAVLDVRRPFTRARAVAAGISPSALRGPSYRRLFTTVYLHADAPPDPLHGVVAALLVHPPGAFASHASAARVYDVPLPAGLADEHVSVFDQKDRRRRDGIRNHIVAPTTPVVRIRGVPVSSPGQLFVELAEQLSLVDLAVVGDFLVKRTRATPEELLAFCVERGGKAAIRAASYVRLGVDSPMETRLRMLIVLAGLPEPAVNFAIFREDGRLRYRFDLSYPDLRIVVEYDGRQHRADLAQWDHDVERGEWLDDDGWLHVPVFSWGIYRQPDKTLARVAKALRARGCREVPMRPAEDWRAYLPVRH